MMQVFNNFDLYSPRMIGTSDSIHAVIFYTKKFQHFLFRQLCCSYIILRKSQKVLFQQLQRIDIHKFCILNIHYTLA